jgi:hypothetical protein
MKNWTELNWTEASPQEREVLQGICWAKGHDLFYIEGSHYQWDCARCNWQDERIVPTLPLQPSRSTRRWVVVDQWRSVRRLQSAMIDLESPTSETPVSDYAGAVLRHAQEQGSAVRGWFRNTPMVAFPDDDSAEMVRMRWHYERLLIKIATGKVDVSRAADPWWAELKASDW